MVSLFVKFCKMNDGNGQRDKMKNAYSDTVNFNIFHIYMATKMLHLQPLSIILPTILPYLALILPEDAYDVIACI